MSEHTPMYVTNDGMGLATKPNSGTANVAMLWILDCDRTRDRAEWMARACNSHAGLLAACKAYRDLFQDADMRPEDECSTLYRKVCDAIAKATK